MLLVKCILSQLVFVVTVDRVFFRCLVKFLCRKAEEHGSDFQMGPEVLEVMLFSSISS